MIERYVLYRILVI